MTIAQKYLEEIKKTYQKMGLEKEWNDFTDIAEGISDDDRKELLEKCPEIPSSLMEILEVIDGTYFREYRGKKVTQFFFGSDVDDGEYPYYLFSARNIIENKDCAPNFADLIYYALEEPDEDYGPFLDDRILTDAEQLKWICFSDCMNNGGTSSLFIDLTPSEKGKKGQIIRYLHDPDELMVIADSFDEYLEMLMKNGMKFLHEDDFE